jgi:hypothetical protein
VVLTFDQGMARAKKRQQSQKRQKLRDILKMLKFKLKIKVVFEKK